MGDGLPDVITRLPANVLPRFKSAKLDGRGLIAKTEIRGGQQLPYSECPDYASCYLPVLDVYLSDGTRATEHLAVMDLQAAARGDPVVRHSDHHIAGERRLARRRLVDHDEGRLRQAGPQPRRTLRQPRGRHGLEQVVGRGGVEGLQRVLVVGRHEDEQGQGAGVFRPVLGDGLGRLQPREARHADVQEAHLRPVLQRQLDSRRAAAGLRHDAQRRPRGGQLGAQVVGQQRFVFGDEGGRVHDGISMRATLPPPGWEVSSKRAASP